MKINPLFISLILFGLAMNKSLLAMSEETEDSHKANSLLEQETQADKHVPAEHHESEPGEAYIVYFVIVSLIIGALLRRVKKLTNIPYTPMLLVVGVILGAYYKSLGDFGTAVEMMLQINPHGILFIFIPTLIFESAFNIDPFIFKKEVWQILILAVFGVVIGIFMIGFGFKIILGYGEEFSWSACFTFSAIICATDPVAVVALLKELGTSARFNILLEGESLFNDGTAMVFYMMFSNIFKAQSKSIIDVILNFFQLTIGGTLLGLVVCLVIVLWLKRIVRDDILTINLTFIACYFTFFVGEFYLSVSGIIAIVVLGIAMSIYGKVSMNPESEHAIHSVWGYIQYALETVIFLLTGAFIGRDLIGDGLATITQSDIVRMFAFFIIMIIARFLMLQILKPLLNKTGWHIDNKDITILTYGGLRGAIALSLALMAVVDEGYPDRFREIVLFYTTSMITLTVLFNGLTISYVMKKINFQPKNPISKRIKEGIRKKIIIETYKKKQRLIQDKFLRMANWEEILECGGLKSDVLKIKEKNDQRKQEESKEMELHFMNKNLIKKDENITETRVRFYQLLKTEIWNSFEESMCSPANVRLLQELVNICLEEVERPIWIWEYLSGSLLTNESVQKMIKYKDTFFIGYFAKKFLITNLMYNYEIIFTIIQALRNINDSKKTLPFKIDFINTVFAEVEINLRNCEDYLFNFIELFPDLAQSIQQKQAAKMLLNTQKALLDDFYHKGSITESEYQKFRSLFDLRLSNLEIKKVDWRIRKVDLIQLVSPIFTKLSQVNFKQILKSKKSINFKKGQKLYEKNVGMDGIYILKKGIVKEFNDFFETTHGIGSVLSFATMLNPSGKTLSEAFALEDDVQTEFIPNTVIQEIMQIDQEFEEAVYRQSVYTLFRNNTGMEYGLDENKIHYLLVHSTLKMYENDSIIGLEHGGYLFSGKLAEHSFHDDEKEIVIESGFIPAKKVDFKSLEPVTLLRFDTNINRIHEESGRMSMNKQSFRDSFINVANLEKDIDKLYSHLEKKILKN